MATTSAGAAWPPEATVVFFDGPCVLCQGVVRWLCRRDARALLRFAPLAGVTAQAVRRAHPGLPGALAGAPQAVAALTHGQLAIGAPAAFVVAARLPWPWRLFALLRFLPRFLTAAAYRAVAARRTRTFGRLASCPLPSPALAARFLP